MKSEFESKLLESGFVFENGKFVNNNKYIVYLNENYWYLCELVDCGNFLIGEDLSEGNYSEFEKFCKFI